VTIGKVSTNRSGGNLHGTDYSYRRNLYIINANIHRLHFQFHSILKIMNEKEVKLVSESIYNESLSFFLNFKQQSYFQF
jgi:hypothetical protein